MTRDRRDDRRERCHVTARLRGAGDAGQDVYLDPRMALKVAAWLEELRQWEDRYVDTPAAGIDVWEGE